MKKFIVFAGFVSAMFLFSGCANNGVILSDMLTKNNKITGIRTMLACGGKANFNGISGYKNESNIYYKCGMKVRLHAIATKALENGYPYFVLVYPEGSNKQPQSIVSVDQSIHYCVAGYYDKETDLLDDKCGHIGLGNGAAGSPKTVEAYFYKKRNPMIAMWDAKRVLRKITPTLVNECWSGDQEAFNKYLKRYNDFGRDEID